MYTVRIDVQLNKKINSYLLQNNMIFFKYKYEKILKILSIIAEEKAVSKGKYNGYQTLPFKSFSSYY